ncbi:fungal-specific transcription factor domain-containing protein [Fusarium solani]|uniref:Fungal-specific transcription factor domain-containing protein n=1 Tax=Fusarium solani TaxID=169388 RepID=A0A9P9GFT5_FUSSL|nr:fungal-specific transcription factor domain-containing protein [Fusarium solani]KAH7237189.1 fungal-specific transcription factor domain-containing protein [Fusarium solani]
MSQVGHHATACKGCRRRGRKCDRTLPACLSCQRRGVECEGYITRWPGVAARGKLAGKSIPVCDSSANTPKPRPKRAKRGNIPVSSRDAIERELGHNSNDSRLNVMAWIGDDELESLIKHYVQDLSSIFYLGTGPSDNPMFRYVLPLIDTVPPIRYAIAASASCHLAVRTSDKELEKKSLYLRVHATHLLREMLRDPCPATDQSILASMLMLAQLDMCSGDCLEFETHLKAAVVIIRGHDYDHASNRHYFEQRLAWLDMMASTTSPRLPNLSTTELKAALGRCSNHGRRQWSYDVFPCPIDLFEILGDITMLSKTQLDVTSPSQETMEEAHRIKCRLAAWEWLGETSGPRKHMVEVWCLGIMAYLGRLFPSTNSSGAADLTSQILYHARLIPPASPWSYSLLWPIFQIGVTLGNEALEERAWVEKRLNIALEAVGCRHFSNALETLRFVWDNDVQYDPLTASMNGRIIMLA